MILEFFIAFFGIIFFGTRLIGDKTRSVEATRRIEDRTQAQKEWWDRYEDYELEKTFREMIWDKSKYDEVWAALKDDYCSISSYASMGYVPITIHLNTQTYPRKPTRTALDLLELERKNALRLMMAHHGKICAMDSNGIEQNYSVGKVSLIDIYDLIVRIDEVSRANGGPRVLFKPMFGDGPLRPISPDPFQGRELMGSYIWECPFDHL